MKPIPELLRPQNMQLEGNKFSGDYVPARNPTLIRHLMNWGVEETQFASLKVEPNLVELHLLLNKAAGLYGDSVSARIEEHQRELPAIPGPQPEDGRHRLSPATNSVLAEAAKELDLLLNDAPEKYQALTPARSTIEAKVDG